MTFLFASPDVLSPSHPVQIMKIILRPFGVRVCDIPLLCSLLRLSAFSRHRKYHIKIIHYHSVLTVESDRETDQILWHRELTTSPLAGISTQYWRDFNNLCVISKRCANVQDAGHFVVRSENHHHGATSHHKTKYIKNGTSSRDIGTIP